MTPPFTSPRRTGLALLAVASVLLAITFLCAAGIVLFFSYAINIGGRPLSWLTQAGMALWFLLVAAGLTGLGALLWRMSGVPGPQPPRDAGASP